jgi:hypothetical protein
MLELISTWALWLAAGFELGRIWERNAIGKKKIEVVTPQLVSIAKPRNLS